MTRPDKKEVDQAINDSLKRAKSTYSWITGAKKAQEKEEAEVKNTTVEKATPKDTTVESTKVKNTTALSTRVDNLKLQFNGYYVIPNDTDQAISKMLQPSEEVIYRKLYRWSWGYNRNYCTTSIRAVVKQSNIKSDRTVREALHHLIELGFIEKCKDNSSTNPKGTTYLVHIPRLDEQGELGFLDSPAVVENTVVENSAVKNTTGEDTTVESTKASPAKNTVVNPTTPNETSPGDTHQEEKTGAGKQAPVKNTTVESTDKDKHSNTNSTNTNTLSPKALVEKFYSLLGQPKVSKQKKERGVFQIKKLIEDAFTLQDIDFAISWVVQNKSGIHSFGIVPETIGQALSEKQNQQNRKLLEKQRKTQRAKEEKQRHLHQRIQQVRNKLSPKELDQIHTQAQERLDGTSKLGKNILVRVKEDQIIKEKYLPGDAP